MRAVAGFLCGALLLLGVIPELSAANIKLFSCGFETNFCGMTQRTDDHFDWTRHNGGTQTGKTGPSSAYNGTFYIYIEATDVPPRNAAEVETGSLQHSGTACVTFAYHMYGVGSGFLVVKATSANKEWSAFSDQGDHWRLGTTEVDLRPADRVSFRAITSSDTRGDIALDDIVIRTGGCRSTLPLPFSCSFEEGFCGMLQSYDDNFDWTRFDRPTGTGPQEAADGTWFIYMETDHPRVNGDVAKIETPSIDFTGHVCVRFKYYMSGNYSGVLVVHLVNGGTEPFIFSVGGDQGSEWRAAAINVTEIHSGDWLRFTGQRGSEPRDIGVDDVLISPGLCSGCQVNNGGCDHICTGSGTCSCRQGYTLDGTNTCVDVNECTPSTHGCAEGCHNTMGSYRCTCPGGMTLEADGLSCTDQNVDECLANETCQPLWQVIVAVLVVVLAVIAFSVGIAVYLKRRKMASQAAEPDRVHYENDAALTSRPTGGATKSADEAPYEDVECPRPATRPTGDVTKPADEAPYEDVECPRPATRPTGDVTKPADEAPYEDAECPRPATRPTGDVIKPAGEAPYEDVECPRPATRSTGDVTKPADEVPYEDVECPRPVAASAVQIQMSPPRADPQDPNPGGYEDLQSYQSHVRGPYDVII